MDFTTDYDLIMQRVRLINPLEYAQTRNYLHGAVTYLSPYISRGIISGRQVQSEMLVRGYKYQEIEKLLQELAWREYYQRVWQFKGDLIWEDLKQPQPEVLHTKMVSAIADAKTGISAIDKGIEDLYATGYMHNHLRMYVASIVCNIAKAHWLHPAKWLYYHLLDGDLASNNCSWQWVAGAFSSRKYYCNQDNINRYTHSNQRNTFLDKPYDVLPGMALPAVLESRVVLDLQTVLPVTPLPDIDVSKKTLIYNGYNLDPLWRESEDVNRILLLEPSHFNKYPVSNAVIDFIVSLARNIDGIQIYSGEMDTLLSLYENSPFSTGEAFIAKEHPAFRHYPGIKDIRDWIYPQVNGYYPSFFNYWKRCEVQLKSIM